MHSQKIIYILGAGSFGIALASQCKGKILIYTRDHAKANLINYDNYTHFGYPLPQNVRAISNIDEIKEASAIFSVVPANATTQLIAQLNLSKHIPFILCSKGLDAQSGKFLSEIFKEIQFFNPAIFAGPNFAIELIQKKPASAVLATDNIECYHLIQSIMPNINIYYSSDIIGIDIAAAYKNIIAIAAGFISATDLGENFKAAFITKALQDGIKLAQALGGRSESFLTVAGIGDVILSCSSSLSRNFELGVSLANNENIINRLEEGKHSIEPLYNRSLKLKLELKTLKVVNKLLNIENNIEKIKTEFIDSIKL